VTKNVLAGAEASGRVFAIEYDMSGSATPVLAKLQTDWMYLVDTLKVTASSRYLRHKGNPVILIWGFGFTDRNITPDDAAAVIDWFHNKADTRFRATVVGGVPSKWRTLTDDSRPDPAWANVYRSFDVISPWAVGRYADDAGADNFKNNVIVPDLHETGPLNIDYLPIVFPGFSWHNLNGAPSNQIPRRGGKFFWHQVMNAVSAGATMVKVGMFDENDEGTAMFKLAPTAAQTPAQAPFVALDADGQALPSDWYLRVAGAATQVLRGVKPPTTDLPIVP
jgi:hypothetical protein